MSRSRFSNHLILRCAVTACVSLVMITCLSVVVCATGTTYSTGCYYYQIEDGSAVVSGYFGDDKAIEIPSSMAGYPVSEIGSGAFVKCTKLKRITLPDTIMAIGENAFRSDQEVIYPERLAKERDKAIEDEEQNTAGSVSGSSGKSSGSGQATAGKSSNSGSGSVNRESSSQDSSGSGSGSENAGASESKGSNGSVSGSDVGKSGSAGSTGGSDSAVVEESGESGTGSEADITDSMAEDGAEGTVSSSSGANGTIIMVIAVIAAIIAAAAFAGRKKNER